jgi:hypothetical protein
LKFVPPSFRSNYSYDPALNFNFEKYPNLQNATFVISVTKHEYIKSIKGRKLYLNLEEPNGFLTKDLQLPEGTFDQVFSICPFTTKFFNRQQENAGEYVFFPTNFDLVPESQEKDFDCIYSGHLLSPVIRNFLTILRSNSKLKLCVISGTDDELVTHKGISYREKMQLVARSKFSIIHNQLFVGQDGFKALKRNLPNWKDHEAFSALPRDIKSIFQKPAPWQAPQLKSRLFEATATGAIPIVITDPWNLAGDWFSTDELIYTSEEHLLPTLLEALGKSSEFNNLRKHLKNKTREDYSTDAFATRYLAPLF